MLGLGDALVKQGKLRQAKMAYESIPKIPAYVNWPFKETLAHRIANMEALQKKMGRRFLVASMLLNQRCCFSHQWPALAATQTCNPAGRYVCP